VQLTPQVYPEAQIVRDNRNVSENVLQNRTQPPPSNVVIHSQPAEQIQPKAPEYHKPEYTPKVNFETLDNALVNDVPHYLKGTFSYRFFS
jgi:hypothetical protein